MRLTDTNLVTAHSLECLRTDFAPRYNAHISKIYLGYDPFYEGDEVICDKYLIDRMATMCVSFIYDIYGSQRNFPLETADAMWFGIIRYVMHGEDYVGDDAIAYLNSVFEKYPKFAAGVCDFLDRKFSEMERKDKAGDNLRKYGTLGKNAEYIGKLYRDTITDLKASPTYERLAGEHLEETLERDVMEALRFAFTTRMPNYWSYGLGREILIADAIIRYSNFSSDKKRFYADEIESIRYSLCNHCTCIQEGVESLFDGVIECGGVAHYQKKVSYHKFLCDAVFRTLENESVENIERYKRYARKNLKKSTEA